MSDPALSISSRWFFGVRIAEWVSTLDHENDDLLWHLLRYEDHVRASDRSVGLRPLHLETMKLRRSIAPGITIEQVRVLDAILADTEWRDNASLNDGFSSGYFAARAFRKRKRIIPWVWTSGCRNGTVLGRMPAVH